MLSTCGQCRAHVFHSTRCPHCNTLMGPRLRRAAAAVLLTGSACGTSQKTEVEPVYGVATIYDTATEADADADVDVDVDADADADADSDSDKGTGGSGAATGHTG